MNSEHLLYLFYIHALLHESDISQLNLKNFNQNVNMTSELFIVDLKPPSNDDFSEL